MADMQAVVRDGAEVAVRRLPVPALAGPEDVRLRVILAGLCRTDLYVAEGRLAARPLHES